MEVIPGSVVSNGNGAKPPVGGGKAAKGERRRGAAKPNGKHAPNGNESETLTGRQDKDGQEAVVDVTALKKGMPKAIKLEKDLADARADASSFYKKFAKEAGLNAAQLRAAAKAYADEEIEAARRKASQMSLIFTECGG